MKMKRLRGFAWRARAQVLWVGYAADHHVRADILTFQRQREPVDIRIIELFNFRRRYNTKISPPSPRTPHMARPMLIYEFR